MPTMIVLADGTIPVAADFMGNFNALNRVCGVGTTITGYVAGDLLYASATDTLQRLAAGDPGEILTMSNDAIPVPSWGSSLTNLPRGYLAGYTLANNATDATNDLDIGVGACRSADNTADLVLTSALTKRIDATWVAGTNQGGLDTGTVVDNPYFIWAIKHPTSGVVDALFSLSATAPTMPTGFTIKRRIGAIVRTASTIKPFTQYGDRVMYVTPSLDVSNVAVGTAAGGTEFTLLCPGIDGLEVLVNVIQSATTTVVYFRHPDWADLAGSATANALGQLGGVSTGQNANAISVFPDATRKIRARGSNATNLWLATLGWIDRRGRDD